MLCRGVSLLLVLFLCTTFTYSLPPSINDIDSDFSFDNVKASNPDMYLSTPELIVKHGYPAETHEVTTEDGYILTVHRIPCGKGQNCSHDNVNRPVVFLQHGLLCSSSDWIMNTPEKALAYMLADAGYDVWMGNARGNTYSRGHTSLSTKNKQYWKFSWDQMAQYDIPAVLEYVLSSTNHSKLNYVGHSMGSTMFFALMSTKAEYNQKINLMIGLGPAGYVAHVKTPLRYLAPLANKFGWLLNALGTIYGEFLPSSEALHWFSKTACHEGATIQRICSEPLFLLCGYDTTQLNMTALPVILAHTPAGTSTQTVVHYAQEINSGKFQKYNYGRKGNLQHYHQKTPPEYDISKITAPVSLFYDDNDWLADPKDVLHLQSQLPNLVSSKKVAYDRFNHLDFLWAKDADTLVYNDVLEQLRQAQNNN